MNPRGEAGRVVDRTPTRSPRRSVYIIGLLVAAAAAVKIVPSRPALAAVIIVGLVAVMATSRAPSTLNERVAAAHRVPVTRQKPTIYSDLNLAGEKPTSRSDVEVLVDASTSPSRHRMTFGLRGALWVVTLGAVVFVVIGWLAVSSDESAVWSLLTSATAATAALSLLIGVATRRQTADRHSLEVDQESADGPKIIKLLDATRAGLDVGGEDTRATARRSR